MYLSTRESRPEDLASIFPFAQAQLGIPVSDKKSHLAFWAAAIEQGMCIAPIVEDRDQPQGASAVGWGMTMAISEQLVAHARSEAGANPWRWLMDRWRQGHAVWLEKKEARCVESVEGASIIAIGYGLDTARYSEAEAIKIKELISVAYQQEMMRHRMRYFIQEVEGAEERDRLATFGCEVWRDYAEHADYPRILLIPEAKRPYLMGADFRRAAQLMKRMETVVGKQALMGPPRFGFKEAEQDVMRLGLQGLTDEEIAERLRFSLSAIKKRWQGIYEKAEDRGLTFEGEGQDDNGSRMKQRRRQVLQMMSARPEEFWAQD